VTNTVKLTNEQKSAIRYRRYRGAFAVNHERPLRGTTSAESQSRTLLRGCCRVIGRASIARDIGRVSLFTGFSNYTFGVLVRWLACLLGLNYSVVIAPSRAMTGLSRISRARADAANASAQLFNDEPRPCLAEQ